jgi:hypothetical protein
MVKFLQLNSFKKISKYQLVNLIYGEFTFSRRSLLKVSKRTPFDKYKIDTFE